MSIEHNKAICSVLSLYYFYKSVICGGECLFKAVIGKGTYTK